MSTCVAPSSEPILEKEATADELPKVAIKALPIGFQTEMANACARRNLFLDDTKCANNVQTKAPIDRASNDWTVLCNRVELAATIYQEMYVKQTQQPNPWAIISHINSLIATSVLGTWIILISSALDTFHRSAPEAVMAGTWHKLSNGIRILRDRADWENRDTIDMLWRRGTALRESLWHSRNAVKKMQNAGAKRERLNGSCEEIPATHKRLKLEHHVDTLKYLLKNAVEHINGAAGSTSTMQQLISERGVCVVCFELSEKCGCSSSASAAAATTDVLPTLDAAPALCMPIGNATLN